MCDELNFTMDKKVPARQSPCLTRNNGEKKSDYLSNKNGKPKKHREGSNGSRSQDSLQQTPRLFQKYGRGFSDKRPRQRGYPDHRHSEEVAEPFEIDIELLTSRKSKGNANHLLNFSYQERGYSTSSIGSREAGSWGSRKTFRLQTPKYKKEQYLQASCQFIVQDDGDYSQQAIDPDTLVDWDKVQLVRTFSLELVCCPICLDVPIAAKITRCGHTYCWGCILHYLHVNYSPKKDIICPVCPERIDSDNLRSVQNIIVPDYKVGDNIEMKLMRKSKGSVFVCPEEDWSGNSEVHLNINAGNRTKFSKLLLASWQQVKTEVIDKEKEALSRGLVTAEEEEEVCFFQMAQQLLEKREEALQMNFIFNKRKEQTKVSKEESMKKERNAVKKETKMSPLPSDVSFDGSKIDTIYTDAFDEEIDVSQTRDCGAASSDFMRPNLMSDRSSALVIDGESCAFSEEKENCQESNKAEEDSQNHQDSHIEDLKDTLTPEEATDHLELPDTSTCGHQLPQGARSKDTYHFYQASSGQHIYMHSLNAQCLTREYGNLENSPRTIAATIVAIERIFMTEEMRKRLRYLNHIPLTTEFHVVELKIKPPVISKETLKHFQPEFDKRRKLRQRKAKEEKARASKNEMEHKKAHGIYVAPEIHIPLDNATHFPSHLVERQRRESTNSDIFPDSTSLASDGQGSPVSTSPRSTEALAISPSFVSFAEKLRGNSIAGTSPPTWPRVSPSLVHSSTMPEIGANHSKDLLGAQQFEGKDADDGEAYQAPSMASAWLSSLHDLTAEQPSQAGATQADAGGKKKKKKKEKQLLFSTSMARKN